MTLDAMFQVFLEGNGFEFSSLFSLLPIACASLLVPVLQLLLSNC